MGGVAGFRAGLSGSLESVRADRANHLSVTGAGDYLCPAVGGGTGAGQAIIRASPADDLETAFRPNAIPPMMPTVIARSTLKDTLKGGHRTEPAVRCPPFRVSGLKSTAVAPDTLA